MANYIITFVDAEREKLYAKLALAGASGAGKTVSALKVAYGLTGGNWSEVAVADTENKRALAYVGTVHTGLEIGKFKHVPIMAPYDSDKFKAVIDAAIKIGAKVLIIDSMSHQWEGIGGVRYEAEESGGAFWDWKGPKKKHQSLKEYIQQAPIHIITTLRTKQEYAVVPGGGNNGKNGIQKLGMKPVQEDNFDYEFLCAFHLDEDNMVKATKDNTGLFKGETFRFEPDHGEMLQAWLVEGKEVKSVAEEKAEKEARKQEILAYIAHLRTEEKWKTYFVNLEIKNNIKIAEFPLDTLETLYAKINKPKETEDKPQEGTEEAPIVDEIHALVNGNDALKALHDEYTEKMKNPVEKLELKQQEMLRDMLQARKRTLLKETVQA